MAPPAWRRRCARCWPSRVGDGLRSRRPGAARRARRTPRSRAPARPGPSDVAAVDRRRRRHSACRSSTTAAARRRAARTSRRTSPTSASPRSPTGATDEHGNADTSNGREFAYLPIVAGGTAFTYHLKVGGKLVTQPPAVRRDARQDLHQPDHQLERPGDHRRQQRPQASRRSPIIPVVRSDGSGTTAQFTTWMDKQYPTIWRPLLRPGRAHVVLPAQGHRMHRRRPARTR